MGFPSDIYTCALKLLRRRDRTVEQLRHILEKEFSQIPDNLLDDLIAKRFLDDDRYAKNFVAKHPETHPSRLREALEEAGVSRETIDSVLNSTERPSLRHVLNARILGWRLEPPLKRREAARLFRTLSRLGYPEEEIREELEQLHEQQ